MKKYLMPVYFLLLVAAMVASCKKSDTSPQKDFAASINDKTWWGTMSYAGLNTSYYSIHFNASGSLVWSEMSGDYQGNWVIEGRHLTITLTSIVRQIKADLSNDDK